MAKRFLDEILNLFGYLRETKASLTTITDGFAALVAKKVWGPNEKLRFSVRKEVGLANQGIIFHETFNGHEFVEKVTNGRTEISIALAKPPPHPLPVVSDFAESDYRNTVVAETLDVHFGTGRAHLFFPRYLTPDWDQVQPDDIALLVYQVSAYLHDLENVNGPLLPKVNHFERVFRRFNQLGIDAPKEAHFAQSCLDEISMVPCHMDLAPGNILLNPSNRRLVVIDWALSTWNFPGADLHHLSRLARFSDSIGSIVDHYSSLVDGVSREKIVVAMNFYAASRGLDRDVKKKRDPSEASKKFSELCERDI